MARTTRPTSTAKYVVARGGRYPTRREIEDAGPLHSEKDLARLARWKALFFGDWKNMPDALRVSALRILIGSFTSAHAYEGAAWATEFFPTRKTITIGKPRSVISCLHEIGHVLHGESELAACRFSIFLFREAFPLSFKRLAWRGHLLVKKPT